MAQSDLVPAQLGNSDEVAVGDWVLALGQPFGLESTVTAGIISATHRGVGIEERENFLQTDAAINPGNSGGPLVNMDGQVIGINTAISSRTGSYAGVGFTIPINLAKWVGDQLVKSGEVHRAYMGVGIQPVNAAIATKLGVKPRSGVVVTQVQSGTPADKAGLQVGDVIESCAGVPVQSPQELQIAVERAEVGVPHQLVILRNGHEMKINFVPAEQPANYGEVTRNETEQPESTESAKADQFGLEFGDLTPAVAKRLGLPNENGVVITGVADGSVAAMAGLQAGFVIKQVNRQAVTSAAECEKLIDQSKSDDGVLLLVQTPAGSQFVVLQVG